MSEQIHLDAVDRILMCLYREGRTRLASFLFGRPGSTLSEKNFGTELFVDRESYIEVLLFVREYGAPYLRSISVNSLWSMMTDFVTENFGYIGYKTFFSRSSSPYSVFVSAEDRLALASALATSPMFSPTSNLTLYPLVPVRVAAAFECDRFFLLPPDKLNHAHLQCNVLPNSVDGHSFPPTRDWQGVRHSPSSWLGVRSPLVLVAEKIRNAILGAIALTAPWHQRYMYSGRRMFGGRCTFANNFSLSMSDEPHTPPMMDDITLSLVDHDWLRRLAVLINAQDLTSRRQVRALEYFYRAWFLDSRERFPVLCMALESLVGADARHTREAISFVEGILGSGVDNNRIAHLLRIRGAVVHGAAPDVYDSEHYASYYNKYSADPIRDVEIIVSRCLRTNVFETDMKIHTRPQQTLNDSFQSLEGNGEPRLPDSVIASE